MTVPEVDSVPRVDGADIRRVIEYYYSQGWTDGLPVMPVTESYLEEFLAATPRDPDEVLVPMPHLNKSLTVRLAALNAALAGCLPEYTPVVIAAWEAFSLDATILRAIWQSTTGTAPFSVLYGPLRTSLGMNARGNVWGSGFRANATLGRAIRLGAMNGLGLKPHVFDQATQGNPGKYSCFIAENEEDSPWPSLAADNGFAAGDSAVNSTVIRSVLHIEARHTVVPEQLVWDLADSLCRTGAMVRPNAAGYVVLNPEHALMFDARGWSKDDVRQAIVDAGARTYRDLVAAGKEAIAGGTGWRLPADHPDAIPQEAPDDLDTPVQIITNLESVQIVVAGAPNAGVSSVVETFGGWDRPPSLVKVETR